MSVKETSGVMGAVDEQGNLTIHYPVTKMECVEGLPEALDAKQDALTFDTAPTANSDNPVTSGGVYAALSGFSAGAPYVAGASPPADTGKLWIDTDAETGGLKYHDGSAWVHVPVAYS